MHKSRWLTGCLVVAAGACLPGKGSGADDNGSGALITDGGGGTDAGGGADAALPADASAPGADAGIPGVDAGAGETPAPRWESRGVGGGGALYSPALSPHDVNQIYIATDMGAVFRTQDFGAAWQTVPFTQLMGGTLSQVRFTSRPEILYALHHDGDGRALRKSVDGGRTWLPVPGDPTDNGAFYLAVDPDSTERLLLTDWSTLYFSANGGASFAPVHTCDGNVGCILAGVHWEGASIFAGTAEGLLVSRDNGAGFTLASVGGIPADQVVVAMASARTQSARRFLAVTFHAGDAWGGFTGGDLGGYAGVYRLEQDAPAWEPVSVGIAGSDQLVFVDMPRGDTGVAYLAGGNPEVGSPVVYKTVNGGASWTSVLLTEGNQNVATGWAGSGGDSGWSFGEYALGFAVSPVDPRRAVITDLGFVHVTDDGGQTWRQAYVNPLDQNPAGQPTPKGRSYRTSGVEQTSGWWLTWANASTVFGSVTDIRSVASMDSGVSWSRPSANGLTQNTTYHAVAHADGTLYAATSTVHDLYQSTYLQDARIDAGRGSVMASADQGATWQVLHDFQHPVVFLALDPQDANTLYASVVHSTAGGLYVTHGLAQGAGASWTRLAAPPRTEGHPLTITVLQDGTLVCTYSGRRDAAGAFTESSGVFTSTDQGSSWQDRSVPEMRRWTKDLVVDPQDASQSTWYAAVFSHWGSSPNEVGGLYKTTNRGADWTVLAGLYRVESCAVDPTNPDRMYVTTEAAGLWITDHLRAAQPQFTLDPDYPFAHPLRVFFNPFQPGQAWVTSFGGGFRVRR